MMDAVKVAQACYRTVDTAAVWLVVLLALGPIFSVWLRLRIFIFNFDFTP
jgi:hypothetical protein